MIGPALESLPIETIQEISGFLDRCSAFSFSLASTRCRCAANATIFSTVRIKVSTSAPRVQIGRWIEVLNNASSLQHVRHLEVVPERDGLPHLRRLDDCGDRSFEKWKYWPDSTLPSRALEHDAEWLLLAYLTQTLPGISDFTWGCREQIPACVLRTLHASKPGCRLHLQSFTLRSLIRPASELIHLHAYEFELATSPCLHSIALRYDLKSSAGYTNYNEEAVMELIVL